MDTKEQVKKLEQKIHQLQTEKKRLLKKEADQERKKRDHALIVIGATVLSMCSEEEKNKIINGNDEEISKWVFENLEFKIEK